jgi:hypothetical protein
VAHTSNPSYSGDGDQEDHDSKPALGKQFTRSSLEKNPSQKRAVGVAQKTKRAMERRHQGISNR